MREKERGAAGKAKRCGVSWTSMLNGESDGKWDISNGHAHMCVDVCECANGDSIGACA